MIFCNDNLLTIDFKLSAIRVARFQVKSSSDFREKKWTCKLCRSKVHSNRTISQIEVFNQSGRVINLMQL